MGGGLRRAGTSLVGVTGFGWELEVKIPAFAGMTGVRGIDGVGGRRGTVGRRGNDGGAAPRYPPGARWGGGVESGELGSLRWWFGWRLGG